MTAVATTAADFFEAAFAHFVKSVRTYRTRRAQRIALATLMDFGPDRLDDLGIDAFDIAEALQNPPGGERLATRRAARAAAWTPNSATAAA